VTKICVLPFYENKSMSYCLILGDVQLFFYDSVVIGHSMLTFDCTHPLSQFPVPVPGCKEACCLFPSFVKK
jgi:hypothetical protein